MQDFRGISLLWNYYHSFYKIFVKNGKVESRVDLFFWDFYVWFVLWNHKIPNKTLKEHCLNYFKLSASSLPTIVEIFGRFGIILLVLVLIPLKYAFTKDLDFWQWIRCPDIVLTASYPSNETHPTEINEAFTYWPSSISNMYYVANLERNADYHTDKRIFYNFCLKHKVPTIQCFGNKEEILEHIKNGKENEFDFVIKPTDSAQGRGFKLTKDPLSFLDELMNESVVIQPRLRNHSSIIEITKNPNCLCSFRVMTYNTELNEMGNKTECCFKYQSDESIFIDISKSTTFMRCDIKNETVEVTQHGTLVHLVLFLYKNVKVPKNAVSRYTIKGLKEFISYCESVHWDYFDNLPGIGWDVTKIEDGKWIIIEANTVTGYYPTKLDYCSNLLHWYIAKADYNFPS